MVGRGVATRKWRRNLVCFGWAETASRHGFDVATWAVVWEVATWISVSRPGSPTMGRNEVATWKRCRDIGEALGGRDLAWGLGRRNGVATPFGGRDLEWPERCRETNLMSRHGLTSRRLRPGNEVATWPGAGQGREVAICAHDLGATRVTCAR